VTYVGQLEKKRAYNNSRRKGSFYPSVVAAEKECKKAADEYREATRQRRNANKSLGYWQSKNCDSETLQKKQKEVDKMDVAWGKAKEMQQQTKDKLEEAIAAVS
jgi:hypothetical protein